MYVCTCVYIYTYVHMYIRIFLLILDPSSVFASILIFSDQMLGQPLTLECRVRVENEMVSTIDIIWRSENIILETVEGVTATNNSQEYVDTYNITQLSTEDNGRIYKCEAIVSTSPLVAVSDDILIDVTGENHYKLALIFTVYTCMHLFFSCSTYSNHNNITK